MRKIASLAFLVIIPCILNCSDSEEDSRDFIFTTVDKVVEGHFEYGRKIKVHGFLTLDAGGKFLKLSLSRDYSKFNGMINLDVFYPSADVHQGCLNRYVSITGTVVNFSGLFALDYVRDMSPLDRSRAGCIDMIEKTSYSKKLFKAGQ